LQKYEARKWWQVWKWAKKVSTWNIK
jgi:hypothetical protein